MHSRDADDTMPIDIERFLHVRPYVYHVTASENLPMIAETMELEPTASLLRRAGRMDLLRWRRAESVRLDCGGHSIILKDQAPLIANNVALGGGWEFGDFVEYLNEHVFFWPGNAEGPVKAGIRLQARYRTTSSTTLRLPTADLFRANPGVTPLFCPFNSGAPRQQSGKRVVRDSSLFRTAGDFSRRESEVVELGFRSAVTLPTTSAALIEDTWVDLNTALE